MPMYDPSALYIDQFLTDFATGYRSEQYYADILFPFTTVRAKSGLYRVFDRSNRLIWFDRREPGMVANEIRGRKWSSGTYKTVQHSLQAAIADEERRELASLGGIGTSAIGGAISVDPEQDATELIVGALQRGHEKKVSTAARNVANYPAGSTVTLAGSSQFDDYTGGVASTSDPVTVLTTAVRAIGNKIGIPPNVMLIPAQGTSYIQNHPRIRAQYANFSLAIPDAWKVLTGFQGQVYEVGIGDDLYNTADNIEATESLTSMWGKDIILAYVNNANGVTVQTFAKTFVYPQLGGEEKPIDRWREDNRKSDLVRQTWEYDPTIVNSSAGYLVKNAFSTGAW